MEPRDLVKKGNTLKVQLDVKNSRNISKATTTLSPTYLISGTTLFQLRVTSVLTGNSGYHCDLNLFNIVFIRFAKNRSHDKLTYSMMFTSNKLGLTNRRFTSDDSTWRLVNENDYQEAYTIDVSLQVDVALGANTFEPLYEDLNLADFELRGKDGSVRFHKAVLAASSPVLMTMLGGSWRETTDGHVDVPGTSKKTLQHLKNYMYLHTVPDEDLEQLLLLATYYMMPGLEQTCVDRLVSRLTTQNTCDLLEFAGKHKVTKLLVTILECAQNRAIDVNEIREHIMLEEIGTETIDKDHDIDEDEE